MMVQMDAESFPRMMNLSAAFLQRVVLVPKVRPMRREYVYVPVESATRGSAIGFFGQWGMAWESGAYRVSYFKPKELRTFVPESLATRLEKGSDDFELHLVPSLPGERNLAYDALYHLLPLRTLQRFGLPVRERGHWPATHGWGPEDGGTRSETLRLRKAFAHHVWPLLSPASPMRGLSQNDSLVMLAHDLDFWFPHLDLLIEEMLRDCERCAITKDDDRWQTLATDIARLQTTLPPDVEAHRPRKGTELWCGEEEAWQVTQDLVERADRVGRLRGIIDAIRSGREHDDFSPIWSRAKEDFERKLYRKRSKARVSFVELHDTAVVHGPDAELVDSMLWSNMFALADRRERRVIVCLRAGLTHVSDIAAELGYQNHSPVSKALARIRALAERLLES